MMYMDAAELARTMVLIEHVKKYGVYDFYSTLDLGQANKWIKTMEKAFTTLQLSNEEKMDNVYGLMFDKADDWLTQIQNLYREVLNWQGFQEEFYREYLTKNYQKREVSCINQSSTTIDDGERIYG